MTRLPGPGPFAALGLPARPGLTDDEVRAAWRRVAAATHPDRADGGDPARFAAAAAAYTTLRTRSGRGEALAGLAGPATQAEWSSPGQAGGKAGPVSSARRGGRAAERLSRIPGSMLRLPARITGSVLRLPARARGGRPAVLLARLAATAAAAALAVIATGWGPASAAVTTGAVTWLVLTARHDLAPPP